MSEPDAASHTLPLRNCYWVVPGLLLAGEHPNGPTRDKTKDRLKKLLAAGIECFVDLTKPTELLRYDTFLPFYVEYARKSIKDHGLPSGRSQMIEILEYIANSMRAGRPVYVHCRAGIGRTGTVVGCLLAERGMVGNAAIDELNRLWQQCRRSRSWPFVPETDAQAHFVRDWQPSLDSGFDLSSLATAVATVGSMSAGIRGQNPGVGRLASGGGLAGADGGRAGAGAGGLGTESGLRRGAGVGGPGAEGGPRGAGGGGLGAERGLGGAGVGGLVAGGGLRGAGGGGLGAEGGLRGAGVGGLGAEGGPRGAVVGKAAAGLGAGKTAAAANARAAAGQSAEVVSAAGRAGGIGAGLRAAAEQARAAVARGDVQVKAPPVPTSLPAPTASPGARRDGLQKGEIAPSIRAEIADAMAGRLPPQSSHGTAAPNGGEEAAWVDARLASLESSASQANGLGAPPAESDLFPAEPPARPSGLVSRPEPTPANEHQSAALLSDDRVSGRSGLAAHAGVPPASGRVPESGASSRDVAIRQSPVAVEQPAESDPLLDSDTLAAARVFRERYVGTLFGLAVGDALAAATQFRRPGTFSPVGDMLGGGPFDLPRGAWSDDTAMALCLAESLLERDGFDARDQVQRYSRWQQNGYMTSTGQCVGITASTARSLALAQWRRGMVFPGSHDPEQLDPEPLSRIAAVALFYFASLEATLQQSVDSSRITCQAPAVLEACRKLGRALNCALAGQSKAKILAEAGTITEAAAQVNNTAAAALNAAFWAFSSTDNYRDAVLRAANVGGNSDVVAAVCGQLAGAHYGASAIPQSWRSGLIEKDLIEGIADRLLAHALVSLSS